MFLIKNCVVKLMIRCQSHDILLNFFLFIFYLWFGSLLYYFDIATLIDLVNQFLLYFMWFVILSTSHFLLIFFIVVIGFTSIWCFCLSFNISRFIEEILWFSLWNWHHRVVYVIFRHIIYKLIILKLYVICVTIIKM